jgi:negative regulator of replication initiation
VADPRFALADVLRRLLDVEVLAAELYAAGVPHTLAADPADVRRVATLAREMAERAEALRELLSDAHARRDDRG